MNKLMTAIAAAMLLPLAAWADRYEMDTTHSFIQFKASHLGIGWVVGRFNRFSGEFTYDPEGGPGAQSASVSIETGSLDSNHSERDRHLTSGDYLDAGSHPTATFESTGYSGGAEGGTLSGVLTLWGQEAPVDIEVTLSGAGNDPWGGYRAGFEGSTVLNLADFGFSSRLVSSVEVDLFVEGIRQ